MKVSVVIFSTILFLASCKPAVPTSLPFTFNKPGGAPTLPTGPTSITLVSPATSPNYDSTPTVDVGGVVSGETVKIYTNASCTAEVGSAVASGTTVAITTNVLGVGAFSFYAKSFNDYTSTACSAALAAYEYLGIQPTIASSMTLTNPASSPGSVATPTILLSGVVSGETINIYTDNTCSAPYGSVVAGGTTVFITTAQLAPGPNDFYTNTTNSAGTSACSGNLLSYTYNGLPPATITSLALSNPTSSPNYDSTPTFVASGTSNGDTVTIYTDAGCTALVGTAAATTSTVSITSSALAVATHSFYSLSTNILGTSTCSGVLATYNYLGASPSVDVTWTANREKAVNMAGGGYKVYYSRTSGFDISSATFVDVPYVSGATAPTTRTFTNLLYGTTYFKVVAYSALNAPGSTSGSQSQPSTQFSVSLP